MHRFKPDFIALVTYYPPEQGGRGWPVHSGFQPVIKFSEYTTLIQAENVFTDREELLTGDYAEANITISAVEMFTHALYEGQRFEIYAPPRCIGFGLITKIVNVQLERKNFSIDAWQSKVEADLLHFSPRA